MLTGCNPKEKPQSVNFNDTVELSRQEPSQIPVLNVCIGSMVTPEEGFQYYKRLLDYIGKKLVRKINFIDKNTYAEVNALLKNKSVDIAFVCGGPYIDGYQEFGLELLVAPVVNGKPLYYSYFIVHRDSKIINLGQLRGKSFAFVDPLSNTGKLMPTYILQEEFQETPDTFFKEYLYTYDHDNSIKAVAHRMVDGAAVDSLVWDYMDKKGGRHTKDTKVIKVSPPCGIPPVVARPGLGVELKSKIKDIFLNMHQEKEGKDILDGMHMDKFIQVDDSHYDSIRKIRAELKK